MKDIKFVVFGIILTFFSANSSLFAQPAQFSSRGPGGGGALFASSFNPTDPNEIYISCDMSEIFRTTDLGASWNIPDFRQIQSQKLAAVQFCNNNIRYAIDGANVNGSDLQRPSKSTDGGVTWTTLPSDPTGSGAYSIFADPNNSNIVVVSDYNTLYGSTNGGMTFTQKYHTNNNNAGLLLAGVFFDGNNIYVGTNEGVLLSIDGGATFTKPNLTGIPAAEFIVSFTGAKQGNTTRFFCVTLSQVYAGITGADKNAYKNVYRMDWGGNWQVARTGIDASALPFFTAMSLANINIAYIAGGSNNASPTVYKTTDGGASWVSVFNTSNNQNIYTGWSGTNGDRAWSYGEYALGFSVAPGDPNYAVITDLGFPHVTSSGGTDWHAAYVPIADQNPKGLNTPTGKTYHSVGIENTTCWQITWLDGANMFGCYSDMKGTRSTDAGVTWGFNYTGHNDNTMYYVAKAGARVYGATSSVHDMYQSTTLTDSRINGGTGKVLFSTDNGASWQLEHNFSHPVIWLASDPKDAKTLYASVINSSSGGIFVTHNADAGASSTWLQLTNPPRTEGHPLCIRVLKNGNLLASFSGRRTTVFTASSGVFLSTDGGTSWQDRSDAGMKYWTWDVVVDPYDATENTWYAGVFSGWGGAANNLGGLYKTTNAGVSWTKIKSSDGITSVTFSPSDPNVIYFTGETTGLWYSNNRNSANPTFSQVASYPFRQPMRVFFNPNDTSEVWVSSFGNGMRVGKTGAVIAKPGAVTLISPANADTNQTLTPTLTWKSLAEAASYEIQVSSAQDFSMKLMDSSGVKMTTLQSAALQPRTTYYWRARASNASGAGPWSEVWHFTTMPKAPAITILLSPPNNSIKQSVNQILTWQQTADAASYYVQLSTSQTFATMLIDSVGVKSTSLSINGLKNSTIYYWKVSASNISGNGLWSETWQFTTTDIQIPAPEGPVLISPENGFSFTDALTHFLWHRTVNAKTYQITIAKDTEFQHIVLSSSKITDTTFTLSVLPPNSKYYWRVQAFGDGGNSPNSEVRYFIINIPSDGVADLNRNSYFLSNYPNPFSSQSTILYSLADAGMVSLKLYDILGKEMETIASGLTEAGIHSLPLEGNSMAAGSYVIRLEVNGKTASQIIQVVK